MNWQGLMTIASRTSGDVLVLRVSPYTTFNQCLAAREALLERLGDRVADVLIVAAEQLAVIRGVAA